jgi:hypothetical protein
MQKLREYVDTDGREEQLGRPTRHPTKENRYSLHCSDCGDLYYVDEHILQEVNAAAAADPSGILFRCDECEEEYAEEER